MIYLFLFAPGLFGLFGPATCPGRGAFSFCANLFITLGAVAPLILLLFFVIDATRLSNWFTTRLTTTRDKLSECKAGWPDELVEHFYRPSSVVSKSPQPSSPPAQPTVANLDEECLAGHLVIELMARRTEAVSKLIYYPFIPLFLMIVSRLSCFDDWGWPISIIVLMGLASTLAIVSVFMLRRAAESARRTVLGRLQRKHAEAAAKEDPLADCIKGFVDQIRSERRGAFASFWQHPVLAAILLPSTGIVWAFTQYLQ